MNYDLHTANTQVNTQVEEHDFEGRFDALVEFCTVPKSRDEMQEFMGVTNREYFRKAYLKPLMEAGQIQMALPDKPKSHNQKYVIVS
jgi:ATP-dependent DNA helicase RecG